MLKSNFQKIILVGILFVVLIFTSSVEASKFNMSYLYGNYNYSELVRRTGNSLNEVSPSYFDLYADGSLKLNSVDSEFVKEMHSKDIKVVPFLSNHWDREKGRKALENVDKLTNQIIEAINKYNLDGINVDIENVTEKDKEKYTLLVKTLREKLGNDKTISVAVAANPYNWQTGWHGSYDYTGLAKYADYLMLMTYDEHYEGGDAGPVASIEFVEKSIQYALKKVDSSKIVLGIPFFGRYWKEGVYYGGYGISLTRIQKLTSTYKTSFVYDEATQSAKAVMTIKSSNIKPTVNGNTLNTGNYIIWYENEKSISAKLDLVNKYNLKGTGSWSLGQETIETWNYYTTKLNEKENDSNQDEIQIENPKIETNELTASNWAIDSIGYVKINGWMKGKTKLEFYPKDKLTRAEFATIIVRILNLEEYSSNDKPYKDISGHWAEKYINVVTASGYMQGYEDNCFKPGKFITREEVCKVLSKMNFKSGVKENIIESIEYEDIAESDWSYDSVMYISKYGIVKGYADKTFKPKKEITREEMAVILARAF
ncbi:MAG: S-layer homology domain-containing protein [Clostridia bacterium]|nr:S-layer homology domain-containing protein [Clostridia bacterium]